MKQAVLGATGNIGTLLLRELIARGIAVKALSRTVPNTSNDLPGVERVAVDAEDTEQLCAATEDVAVLYVTASVPYDTALWQQSWPVMVQNVIAAAKTNKCKVVFLDNVYMYGLIEGTMTEDTPVAPVSKKGHVRAQIAGMLLDAMQDGGTVVIARSADFYGPHTRMSDRFFEGAYKEGIATWMGSPDVKRTWSYTLDNAKALAILGNDPRADQQIWHLPAAPAMKGRSFIDLASSVMGRPLQTVLVPAPTEEAHEAFKAQVPELAEMMYQYNYDYIFDSNKFQQTFGMQPTSYEEGFRHIFALLAKSATK